MSTVPSFPNFQPDPEKQKRRQAKPAKATVEVMKIADITISAGIQSRNSVNPFVVQEYVDRRQAGDTFPPVEAVRDPKTGKTYLYDGRHRVHTELKLGNDEIAVRIRVGTERDAWLLSLSANSDHGVPRTNEDKRRAVEKAFSDPDIEKWTDDRIATLCRVSSSMVGSVRRHLGKQEPPGAVRKRLAITPDGKEKEVVVSGPKIRPTAKAMESPTFFKQSPTPQSKTAENPLHKFIKILKGEGVTDIEEGLVVVLGAIPLFSAKANTMWWVMAEYQPHLVCEAIGRTYALRNCLGSDKDIRIVIVGRDNPNGRPWVNNLRDLRHIGITFRTLTD